ncbi:MAG: methionine--tRNA ligase [Candidatus Moranbacteria bacterium]|nr:methionine--tRNA ligase [Candidatus Moranbacteria bacterium]
MKEIIKIDDFLKLDIRAGEVIRAEKVEGADKIIKLMVDFGEFKRTVLTGMAEFYEPDFFVGKKFPFLVNLEPRKMFGQESEGMIMAVDNGSDSKPVLIELEGGALNGSVVR